MNKTNVLITVDTEHSIGGAFRDRALKPVGNEKRIFGRINGKEYGIPFIMDIADKYSIPLVFFVEVLNKYYFGEEETKGVCKYIRNRGYEIQLHLHPCWLNFKEPDPGKLRYKDNMYDYSLDEQNKLIAEGRHLLQQHGIQNPVAFRAGNFGLNHSTITALRQNNFIFDSSYNHAFLNKKHNFMDTVLSDAEIIEGIHEFPVTNFIQKLPPISNRLKPLDINGVSSEEMIHVLNWANNTGLIRNITIILHSFSFLESMDAQYNKVKIRTHVIKRFKNLCDFLNEKRNRFKVLGFKDLAENGLSVRKQNANFLEMPKISVAKRYFEQAFHRVL